MYHGPHWPLSPGYGSTDLDIILVSEGAEMS